MNDLKDRYHTTQTNRKGGRHGISSYFRTPDNLNITPDGIYVDGTMGGGGHSLEIAKRLTTGRLICIDQDPNAHEAAGKRLAEYKDRITFVRDNFGNIANILDSLGIEKIDGMLLDIGVSSHQLDEAERGFSYQQDAPLDMRMNPDRPFSAYDVVNGYDEDELDRVIFTYGEERCKKGWSPSGKAHLSGNSHRGKR